MGVESMWMDENRHMCVCVIQRLLKTLKGWTLFHIVLIWTKVARLASKFKFKWKNKNKNMQVLLGITLLIPKQCYAELTVLWGIFHHSSWIWEIFRRILSAPLNIVLVLNNVMETCMNKIPFVVGAPMHCIDGCSPANVVM